MGTYDIERYLNIRTATGPSIGPEGERVSFLMDTTGAHQVWALEGPGDWPEQLTFYEDRVTFAAWSPTRPELIFGKDQGGDERVQLFRVAGDGSTVEPLTAMPEAKHQWGGWSHDGERFAFTSNRRDEGVFDVYVQDRTGVGDAAELVWEGEGWFRVVGWGPDDERLLLHESRSSFDHDLSVVDIETGERTPLTAADGEVRYQSPNWGPDGESIYLVTDQDADTLYLARLDLETQALSVVAEGGEWNIDALELDETSGRFVFTRNVDGYSRLTVGELTGETTYRTLSEPDLPRGVYGDIDMGPDADRFAVMGTTRTDNPNVYLVDVESGETTRWTDAATAGIPRETFATPELLHYESFDGLEIPAFLTLPSEVPEAGAPVIVDIHGGPESQRRPSFHAVAQYFVDLGYAYLEPNVRGSAGYGREYTHLDDVRNRMDSVRDIEAGVASLKEYPAVDEDTVVAMGGSYGGFMVLAALTEYPDLWAAGIDIVGIANFETFLENTGEWRREHREAEYGRLDEDREFLRRISPINTIDAIEAPLFVAHGARDPRVPLEEAEQVVEAARAQGVPVEKLVFEDEGHGFAKLENRIEAYTAIADFIETHT